MFLMLLLFWFIFNGRITLEILLVGIAVAALITFAWRKIFNKKRNVVIPSPKAVWRGICYVFNLLIDIIKCNIQVMYFVLHPKEEIHPQLLTFKVALKKEIHKVILANSITITPGTITVGLHGDTICVHALDASFMEGIEECAALERLKKMEENV